MAKEIEKLLIKAQGKGREALEAAIMLSKIYTHGLYGEKKDLEKAEFWSTIAKDLLEEISEKESKNNNSNITTTDIENKISKEKAKKNEMQGDNSQKDNFRTDKNFSDRFQNLQFVDIKDTINEYNIAVESRNFDFDVDKIKQQLKNIFIEREITDINEINQIKQRISKYSYSVPNHDLLDLGDKITITSALELPSYKITLDSHYEIRKLKDGTLPYKGESIPKKLLNREDVNVWTFNTQKDESVKDFEERKEANYTIVNSQEVKRCNYCHGHGENICEDCNGRGEIRCRECGGKGKVSCSLCGGRGHISGSSCFWCGGTGYTQCSSCYNGSGYNLCLECDGKGRITCSVCEGEGQVINFLYIEDSFKTRQFKETTNNKKYPQNMINGEKSNIYNKNGILSTQEVDEYLTTEQDLIKKHPLEYEAYKTKMKELEEQFSKLLDLYKNNDTTISEDELNKIKEGIEDIKRKGFIGFFYREKTDKISELDNKKNINKINNFFICNQDGRTILDFTNNVIPENLLESLNTDEYASIKEAFLKVLENSKNVTFFGKLDKDYKILKQKINISKISVVCVKYKYNNREYTIWMYGENYYFVYVEKSPITEIYDDYITESDILLRQKQYSEALKVIDKVCFIDPDINHYPYKLKNKILSKIKAQYYYGGLLGGFFLLPTSFLYIIALIDLQNWETPILGAVICTIFASVIIGFIIGYLSYIVHSISIKKDFFRYSLPVIYSFLLSLIVFFSSFYINGKDYYKNNFYYKLRKYEYVPRSFSKLQNINNDKEYSLDIKDLRPNRLGNFFNLSPNKDAVIYNKNGMYWGFERDFKKGSWNGAAEYDSHYVEASSTLEPQGKFSYYPSNAKDGSRHNAWIEGAAGYGIGEYIKFTSSFKHVSGKNIDLVGLCIVNGYADNIDKWKKNSRVKKLQMYFNNKYVANIFLDDTIVPQYIDIRPLGITVKSGELYTLRFEIANVYKGDKYTDTAITGISMDIESPNN
jgi:hypothetical protein